MNLTGSSWGKRRQSWGRGGNRHRGAGSHREEKGETPAGCCLRASAISHLGLRSKSSGEGTQGYQPAGQVLWPSSHEFCHTKEVGGRGHEPVCREHSKGAPPPKLPAALAPQSGADDSSLLRKTILRHHLEGRSAHRVLCTLGWPHSHHAARNDLELLIHLFPLLEC